MENEKRLIEIPADGVISIPIMFGDTAVGEKRIDLSHYPTVSAVEVKHGRWILTGEAEMSCSVCDDKYYGEWDYECMTPYCPGCGAKMDRLDGDRNG